MLIVDVCFWKFEGSSANPDSHGEVIHLPKPDMFVAAPKMRRRAEGIELLFDYTKSRVSTVLPTVSQMNWSQMELSVASSP
jgi:hypothetical protein